MPDMQGREEVFIGADREPTVKITESRGNER
jgi:hypothetical protein